MALVELPLFWQAARLWNVANSLWDYLPSIFFQLESLLLAHELCQKFAPCVADLLLVLESITSGTLFLSFLLSCTLHNRSLLIVFFVLCSGGSAEMQL